MTLLAKSSSIVLGLACLSQVIFIISASCKISKLGTEYRGQLAKTVNGRSCMNWTSQIPHNHAVFTTFPDGDAKAALNYCRNPDNSPDGPWCYTTDPATRWEYCSVDYCKCKMTKLGTEYVGLSNQTITGRTCQKWTSQVPHNHTVFNNMPDGSQEAAKNFCRNPDNSPDGPWCYTTDPEKRWEYCPLEFC